MLRSADHVGLLHEEAARSEVRVEGEDKMNKGRCVQRCDELKQNRLSCDC